MDFYFVAFGDFKVLTSDKFLDTLLKTGQGSPEKRRATGGYFTETELGFRKINLTHAPGVEEGVYFTTANLLDRVKLSATRYATITRSPGWIIAAGRVDPRFDHDPQHPNQWREITTDENGESHLGSPHPYDNAGFYLKATQLAQPAGAIFIEYHLVFDEPLGWFGGVNLLRSKLPLAIQNQVRELRRKLAAASGRQ